MSRWRIIALSAAGSLLVGLTALALVIQWQDNLARFLAVVGLQGLAYLAAVWAVWNAGRSRPRIILGIAAVAALMRVPIVCTSPYLSSDVYRYVWDGRVEAAGINPYRYVPADPALGRLRDAEISPNINRAASAVTIYPPVAEGIFLAVTRISESATAMKTAMVGFEVVTFCLLVLLLDASGLPTARVAVYAWHPLPLWEFAGSGHIDAALIAFVVAALWAARRFRDWPAGLFLAAATLTKLYPAILLPALCKRRRGWAVSAAFAVTIVVGYLPFIRLGWRVLGFLPRYAGEEGFDRGGAGFYVLGALRHLPLLGGLPTPVFIAGAAAILIGLGARFALSRDDDPPIVGAAVLAVAFTVFVSPHYPWYFAWLIVFACFLRSFAVLWLTNACLLLYLIPVGSQIVRADHRLAVETIIYGPFAALALADLWYHRRRSSGSG